MSLLIRVGPGMKLVARVVFRASEPLFVSIVGPAGISFSSLWPDGAKEIANPSADVWQFEVRASRHGPIGSEVPVSVLFRTCDVTLVGVGSTSSPEALLTCSVVPNQ